MKIAIVLFDKIRSYDFLSFLGQIDNDELQIEYCALKHEIKDNRGLMIKPSVVGESLDGYDIVFISGGSGTNVCFNDEIFLAWLKSSRYAKKKIAFSEGIALFAKAGFLKDKKISADKKIIDLVKPLCKEIVNENFCKDGDMETYIDYKSLYTLEVFSAF